MKVYPSNTITISNSRYKEIFNYPKDNFLSHLKKETNSNFKEVEKKKLKSPFKIYLSKGYTDTTPPDEVDFAILNICDSEREYGNQFTTLAIIARALSGKVGNDKIKVRANQLAQIRRRVEKLMNLNLRVDLTETNKKIPKWEDKKPIKNSPFLPAHFDTITENGKQIEIIVFDGVNPFREIAESRNQILRYDLKLLDVPNQNNTPLVIAAKNFTLRRIIEILKHNMTPVLTFDKLFKICGITDAAKSTKKHARQTINELFEHLQGVEIVSGDDTFEITNFEIVKIRKKFHAVKFDYKKFRKKRAKKLSDFDTAENPPQSN